MICDVFKKILRLNSKYSVILRKDIHLSTNPTYINIVGIVKLAIMNMFAIYIMSP